MLIIRVISLATQSSLLLFFYSKHKDKKQKPSEDTPQQQFFFFLCEIQQYLFGKRSAVQIICACAHSTTNIQYPGQAGVVLRNILPIDVVHAQVIPQPLTRSVVTQCLASVSR